MKKEHFNPDTYAVIDRVTGKEINVKIFLLEANKDRWEKVYAEALGTYIGLAGNTAADVLAYIIKNKDSNNLVHGTYREIAKKSGTNNSAVQKVFGTLIKKEFLKKVRSGCYMLDPKIIRDGTNYKGVVTFKLWGEL